MTVVQKKWLCSKWLDTYDAVQTVIEWEKNGDGFVSTHLSNWVDPNTTSAMSDQKIKVIGTRGRIESDQKNRGIQIVTDSDGIEDFNPYFSQFYGAVDGVNKIFSGYGFQGFLRYLQDIIALKTGRLKPSDLDGIRPTFRSSLVSTAITEAANKSLAANNAWSYIDMALLQEYVTGKNVKGKSHAKRAVLCPG
jgi:hypothetical protein